MWRLDPSEIRPNLSKTRGTMSATNLCLLAPFVPKQLSRIQTFRTFRLTANHGEARAGTGSKSRRPHGGCAGGYERQRNRKRLATGASVESAVLRRSRHANRARRHLVLYGDADRAASAGAAVFDDPQARGRQALSGDAG